MFRNYLKIALRNLLKSKGYSFINIAGLSTGMAVAILIGLWTWDELTANKYFENYEYIAQVLQHNTYNGERGTQQANPYVMAEEIRTNFGADFKYVLQSSWENTLILSVGEKRMNKQGMYFEPQVTDMLSLKMIYGSREGLQDTYSILLSESTAKAFFGDVDPVGQLMRVDNRNDVKVTGVFEDIPYNTRFRRVTFFLPWSLYEANNPWMKKMEDPWGSNFTQTWAQVVPGADFEKLSVKIKDVKLNRVSEDSRKYEPQVFLQPMKKWRLYNEFKNGVNVGGRIEFVWLFGIIGVFVLLLACINFMNLSTARSEKRAREVGIRKSIGSARTQLIGQFFLESMLVALLAFFISLLLVQLALPAFNIVADKQLSLPWGVTIFWVLGILFSVVTGVIAGSYPALYLSSFQPVKVLKGTFRAGRLASLPRKVLVVVQFAVSCTLIIGTVVVFRQIEFAKDRPVGYNRGGLIQVFLMTPEIHKHYDAVRNELKASGKIEEITESGSPPTQVWNTNGGFKWQGKDPNLAVDFPNNGVSYEYGHVMNWEIVQGRDFSREHATDSLAFIINESAARFLGFEKPIGEILTWNDKPYTIVGIVKDMIIESPYEPVRPSLWHITRNDENLVIIRVSPDASTQDAIAAIEGVWKKYDPATPFEYRFVDDDYAEKFSDEERIGKLASFFAILAIFISCLGIFGLASFVAEQRTKELGVRKVLGASVVSLWRLLAKDFLVLVTVSFVISMPVAFYFMAQWLEKYTYRTTITWWIFAASGAGALIITLGTVSYQSIRAAMANPVNSLRSE